MSNAAKQIKSIGYRIVESDERADFIPNLVKGNIKALMNYENIVYHRMTMATEGTENEYAGGMWQFIEFDNGAKAMVWDEPFDKVLTINEQMNYFCKPMTVLNLCIAINICACSDLAFAIHGAAQESLVDNYHKLREVADTLPGGDTIFGFID